MSLCSTFQEVFHQNCCLASILNIAESASNWLRKAQVQIPTQPSILLGDLGPVTISQPDSPHRVVVKIKEEERATYTALSYLEEPQDINVKERNERNVPVGLLW